MQKRCLALAAQTEATCCCGKHLRYKSTSEYMSLAGPHVLLERSKIGNVHHRVVALLLNGEWDTASWLLRKAACTSDICFFVTGWARCC